MTEVRSPSREEIPEILSFLNKELRPSVNWTIADEYPLAFNESNRQNLKIIKENGQILSHALVRYQLIKTPIGIFKVAGIGSVVTHPDHRGKGLSTKIIQSCLDDAKKQGCDFTILWTDRFDFYRRLGFELAGSEIALVMQNEIELENPGLRFLTSSQADPQALLRLYGQHRVGVVRTIRDVQDYLKIPNTIVHTAWSVNNELEAYAIEGKGADLAGYIHEWGGSVSKLLPLLAYARKQKQQPLTLICPKHSENLIRRVKAVGAVYNEGYLGMIKVNQFSTIFNKIHRFARTMGIYNIEILPMDDGYFLRIGEQGFRTSSEVDMIQLIFGPFDIRTITDDPKTIEVYEQVLPIPMWFWGWDSV